MAASSEPVELKFPKLPAKHDQFLHYVATHPHQPLLDLLEPYKRYDTELRKAFAQQPDHPAAKQPSVLPLFNGQEKHVTVRARDPEAESQQQRESYIMPLKAEDRKPDGAPAIVQSFKEFQTNFNVFSESSLVDLDWSNVIVGGSAVVTSLLSVPEKHAASKRALRQYYHEQLAPASDVDLFLYGLDEQQAIEKIKQIERNVRDALLVETTSVRTKNAITIASKHPVRHVQIVLRLYNSISEILTGFDVDCSCAAYDGKQVYVSPRALVSYMTQINTIDLTRRSPSYENRLSKYARRGFEVYWPNLDRSRIDPTIFERSFGRTEGLARLLVLEKLPKSEDRDAYLIERRTERGRPMVSRNPYRNRMLHGNIKDEHEEEIAEWDDMEEVSDYHTVTVPYGPNFHARKIEKLLFTKDMLLNAEWNKPRDREVHLHRHPAFFSDSVEDIIHDCCGFCPEPSTIEEEEVAEQESKKYIKGDLSFMKDDPGRQAIGSFNPITADDWTDMAYVGNTARLCQAIVDEDAEYVKSWLEQEGNDPNTRDYTGRTPLHLAVANSSPEVVQALIDHGARMVARLVDGRTALHLAAMRGNVDMVSTLLRKSEANEEEHEEKVDARRAARKAAKADKTSNVAMQDAHKSKDASTDTDGESDIEMVGASDTDPDTNMNDATTEGSMVNIHKPKEGAGEKHLAEEENEQGPDVYDVNIVAWDTAVSPLHLAIVNGHVDVVKCLVQEFGADPLLPIKLFNDYDKSARAAVLTLVLAMQLDFEKALEMVKTLVSLGASTAQADVDHHTVLEYAVADRPNTLDTLQEVDPTGIRRAINHLAASGHIYRLTVSNPLVTAIKAKDSLTATSLLAAGAKPDIDWPTYFKASQNKHNTIGSEDSKRNKQDFQSRVEQPVFSAVNFELPALAKRMVTEHSVDANAISTDGYQVIHDEWRRGYNTGTSLLDVVRKKTEALKDWEYNPRSPQPPAPMKDASEYLKGFEEGTYAHFVAKRQVETTQRSHDADLRSYKKAMTKSKQERGAEVKQEAINRLIAEYEDLESALVEHGGKTFYELHPEIKQPSEDRGLRRHHRRQRSDPPPPKEFAVSFDFRLGDLTEETRDRYLKLFEAAWAGDLPTVKDLTSTPWQNADGEDQPPLKIALQDGEDLSPFAIAVLQGHHDIASAAMEIAQAQWVKPDPPKARRYGIEDDEDAESDEDSEGDVELYSEVVDDDFTKEDVGEVSLQAKGYVGPVAMLQWATHVSEWTKRPATSPKKETGSSGFSYFGPRKPHTLLSKRTNTGSIKLPPDTSSTNYTPETLSKPRTLIQLAIHNNDIEILTFLLELGREYKLKDTSVPKERRTSFFELEAGDYHYAIQAARPDLFTELVKLTGAGLPLRELVDEYGTEVKEKPKYYQGLTVHGTKRKDWARRNGEREISPDKQTPPLLETISDNNLELAEWWLSDAPLHCYREFAEANKDDKRMQRLTESKEGFEGVALKFLSTRSHLAMHCAITARPTVESMKILRYLLEVMPENLEAKSLDGLQPLQVAFKVGHEGAAKLLIEAGADQMCRDKVGKNIVHQVLEKNFNNAKSVEKLKAMLALIDKRLIPELFLQRAGSLTPLAHWMDKRMDSQSSLESDIAADVVKPILSYSGGQELGFISGEGDTPLHYAVKKGAVSVVKALLEHDPTLLNRENATGRTPYEMAEDAEVAGLCANSPPLPHDYRYEQHRAERDRLSNDWQRSILDKREESFVEEMAKPEPSSRRRVWELLSAARRDLVQQGLAKRRLVTLNEANEVARRLAASKTGGDTSKLGFSRGRVVQLRPLREYNPDQTDEVQSGVGRALRQFYHDYEREEKEESQIESEAECDSC